MFTNKEKQILLNVEKSKIKHAIIQTLLVRGLTKQDLVKLGVLVVKKDNKNLIVKFYKQYNRLPKKSLNNSEESRLYCCMYSYINEKQSTYCPKFLNWFNTVKPKKRPIVDVLKDFYKKNNRLPKSTSKDLTEQKLAYRLVDFTSKCRSQFNPVFAEWVNSVRPKKVDNKKLIKDFYKKMKRFPSKSSNSIAEKKLVLAMQRYYSPSSDGFDLEFRQWWLENK